MNNFTEVTFYCRASVNHFFISGVVLCCVVLCCVVLCCVVLCQPRRRPDHPRMDSMFTPAFIFSYCLEYCCSGKHTVIHKGLQIGLLFDESSSGSRIHIW